MSPRFCNVRLGRVARIRSGDAISKAGMADDGVPVFGANGQMGYISQPNFPQGALCVGRVGSCGAVNHHKFPVFISDNALVVQPLGNSSDASYLEYVLRATDFTPLVNQGAMPLLTGGDLSALRVPLPELRTQTAIANFLDRKTAAIDSAIANKQALIADLLKYRDTVIAEEVAPQEGWRPVRLKHLVRALPKSALPAGAATDDGAVPFYVSGATTKKTAEPTFNGVALMMADGGKAVVHLGKGAFAWSDHVVALEPKDARLADFLYFQIVSKLSLIDAVGFRGAGLPMLDKRWAFDDLMLHIPAEPADAFAIGSRLSKLSQSIAAAMAKAEDSVAMLKKYRASLISEAVTGKIAVPE